MSKFFPSHGSADFALRDLVEFGAGEDPAGVKADREPERSSSKPRIRQDQADEKQCGEACQDEDRLGELVE